MITKRVRQGRILEIIRSHPVRSQQELSGHLKSGNMSVTQGTLSRDIRELGLIKVRGTYQVSGELPPELLDGRLRRALEQYVLSTGISGNIVVIHTSPGNAHSVGVALDAAQWPEILGTVAGDDTIFVLAQSGRQGRQVLEKIRNFSPEVVE
ncbi:MAG: arginine repressor [Acidobacteriota bacterium]|jgi:transcriptional regulator of arginine metabolism